MIIEDEPIIAMDLETIVEDLGHEVVGVVGTRRQAVALAAKCEPELIVADIQLADGSPGSRRSTRSSAEEQAGSVRHRPSGHLSQFRQEQAGAGVPSFEAVQSGFGPRRGQPGIVLRSTGARGGLRAALRGAAREKSNNLPAGTVSPAAAPPAERGAAPLSARAA